MEQGKLKWYDAIKGFGFIETANGSDIFVHRTGLIDSADDMQPDQEVEFEVKEGAKGLFAVNVKTI